MNRISRAAFVLLSGQLLVACNTGKMRPLIRPLNPAPVEQKTDEAPTDDQGPADSPKPAAPTKSDATAPVATTTKPSSTGPAAPTEEFDESSITEHPWCRMTKLGDNYVVTRYTFTTDLDQSVFIEQVIVPKDQAPRSTNQTLNQPWSPAGVPGEAKITAERLSTNEARAAVHADGHRDFSQQTAIVETLNANNPNVPAGIDLGAAGGLRLKQSGFAAPADDMILFSCADYSPAFVKTGSLSNASAPTASPKSDVATPAAPPKDLSAPPTLTTPLRGLEVKSSHLLGTRWCAFTPSKDGLTVSLLQFGSKAEGISISVTQFPKTKLEADKLSSLEIQSLQLGVPKETKLARVDETRFVTESDQRYRQVEDVNGRRALIIDQAGPDDAPTPGADTFFECLRTVVPSANPLLLRNINYYFDLRASWARQTP